PGFSPEFAARFSFSLLTGLIFDLATIASLDHFSGFDTGAAELSPSSTALISTPETEFSVINSAEGRLGSIF
ncbi:MAG: hypothetical protein ACYTXT_44605, partial [Nostoc sp.]